MQTDYEPHPIALEHSAISLEEALQAEPHRFALEYDPLPEGEFGDFVDDIRDNGIRRRITLYRENGGPLEIIDGVQRRRGGVVADHEFTLDDFEVFIGSLQEARDFVKSHNYHRRHLNLAQRKAHAKKLVETNPDKSSREIGRRTGLTHHTVEDIRRKLEPAQTDIEDARPTSAGRKGPGRPALTAAEKEARRAAKETDQDIAAIGARFHSHIRHALETVVAVAEDHGAAIQEKVPAAQRRELLAKFAEALGFRLPADF